MEANGHKPGVVLKVEGEYKAFLTVYWSENIDDQVKRAWNDSKEATEYGATAIALLLIKTLTPYTVIERSFQGTGFDYWLGTGVYDENQLPFQQRKARLEISGIWKAAGSNTVEARLQIKRNQLQAISDQGMPAFIIVVEFGTPKSKFVSQ